MRTPFATALIGASIAGVVGLAGARTARAQAKPADAVPLAAPSPAPVAPPPPIAEPAPAASPPAATSAPAPAEQPVPVAPQPSPPPSPRSSIARRGLSFGVRIGVAAPLGNAVLAAAGPGVPGNGVSESDTSALLFPLWLEGSYRFTPRWQAGLYFQFADALSGSICTGGCGGFDVRFGVSGEYHSAPAQTVDGWVGAGAGYEILHTGSPSLTTVYRGFELGMLQGGIDLRAGNGGARWGPFCALTLAEYDHVRQISPVSDISFSPFQTMHLWFFLGLRGRYDL